MPTQYSSIGISREDDFGSPDGDGTPDASGLTFLTADFDKLDVITIGDVPLTEDIRGRSGPWEEPSHVSTTWVGSPDFERRPRRTGTVVLKTPWYGYGTRTPGPDAHAVHMLLTSSLADTGTPSVATDFWTGVSTTKVTPTTTGDDYDTGQLYGVTVAGTYEVTGITHANDADGLYVSPALPSTLGASTAVRGMRTIYIANDLVTGTAAERTAAGSNRPNSLAIRLDGIDDDRQAVRTYMVGCRLQSAKLTINENRMAMWELTLMSPFVYDAHASGAVGDAPAHDGAALHLLGSRALVTAAATTSAPEELARTALSVDAAGVEVSIEFTLTMLGQTSNALGCYDVEPQQPKVTVVLPVTQFQSALDRDQLDRVRRGVLLTFAGGGLAGGGGAVYIPAGVQRRDGSIRPQVLEYGAGRSQGDDAGGPAANSIFRIGLGL